MILIDNNGDFFFAIRCVFTANTKNKLLLRFSPEWLIDRLRAFGGWRNILFEFDQFPLVAVIGGAGDTRKLLALLISNTIYF